MGGGACARSLFKRRGSAHSLLISKERILILVIAFKFIDANSCKGLVKLPIGKLP